MTLQTVDIEARMSPSRTSRAGAAMKAVSLAPRGSWSRTFGRISVLVPASDLCKV